MGGINDTDENFDLIAHEIDRQFNTSLSISDSLDSKIGIMLGFIMVILTQIILSGDIQLNIDSITEKNAVFFTGVGIITLAAAVGTYGFFVRKWTIGSRILELIECYRNQTEINYQQNISGNIYKGIVRSEELIEMKSKALKITIIFFIIGLFIIFISTQIGG